MMKILFSMMVTAMCVGSATAADFDRVYTDVVTSSYVVNNVTVSSTNATLAVPAATNLSTDPVWFQVDIYNVASSTIAFGIGSSATVAPADLSCSSKAVIGTGTAASPTKFSERLRKGLYLWLKDCNTTEASVVVGRVLKGK